MALMEINHSRWQQTSPLKEHHSNMNEFPLKRHPRPQFPFNTLTCDWICS